MTVMALTVVVGLVVLVFLSLYFASRAAAGRAAASGEVEREAAAKARQEQEAEEALVSGLLAGTPVEKTLAEYQRARAAILTAAGAKAPWDWGPDDLEEWQRRESRRRLEDAGRRVLLPAVGACLLVVTLTVTVLVVLFNALPARPVASPAVGVDALPPPAGAGLPPAAPFPDSSAAPQGPPPAPPAPGPTP